MDQEWRPTLAPTLSRAHSAVLNLTWDDGIVVVEVGEADIMVRGLQVRISGTELSERIADRIRTHDAKATALDERINRRAGDQPFDIRTSDGLETFGELQAARERHRSRVTELMLFRESLAGEETYLLTRADMEAADLMSKPPLDDGDTQGRFVVETCRIAPIDGLKVTLSGGRLREMLGDRAQLHRQHADWWTREAARTPEEQTEEEPLLPTHMCEHEAECEVWRAEVLEFVRDHIETGERYRLGRADLEFGELLPAKPKGMEQQEYEERTAVGFNLERLAKRLAV